MTRPNILLIVVDQLAWRALPAYGDTDARTPNIDRIVSSGVKFTNCYTACPLCQPARAAFWTGHWPHRTGVLSNGRKHHVPPVPEDLPALGQLFRDAGYTTTHFGKRHDAGSLRGFTLEPQKELPVEPEHPEWMVNYDTLQDRYTTVKAAEFLQSYDEPEPYLAVADLNNPHNICGYVGEHAGRHEDKPIPVDLPELPANFRDADLEKRPIPVQHICCSHNRLCQASSWSETNYRHYLAAYYHYLDRVDREIGLILDALDARPDADNTLVVFMADHGDGMAAHGMVTKQVSFIEETAHVPFAFAGPGIRKGVCEGLTSQLDLLPTLCDYAGIGIPEGLWGRSLLPQLRDESAGEVHPYVASVWHTEWGFTISPGRMIRSPRYKYTRYLEGDGEELYDLVNDQGETRTLIDDPAHASALEEHRALLADFIDETGDPFFSLAWEADPKWRNHAPGYHHHTGLAAPMEDA